MPQWKYRCPKCQAIFEIDLGDGYYSGIQTDVPQCPVCDENPFNESKLADMSRRAQLIEAHREAVDD
jgi:hypothetical protein